MRPRLVAAVLAFGASLSAAGARAEPSLWERARNPGALAESRLLAALERMLDARELGTNDPELSQRLSRAAVALVELAKLPSPSDPRLACTIAFALLGADAGRSADAARLLEGAIPKLEPGSLLSHAWHELGIARSLLGDHAGALEADTRVLEVAWDSEQRAVAFYNRAEAEVRLGHLERAADDYLRAGTEARGSEILPLARYGLGVVLERQGDLPAAYTVLEQGLALRLPLSRYLSDDPLDLPGIFFVPAYERFYLRGLLEMTLARAADDPLERRAAYERAVMQWDSYLAAADRSEPWLANAERHRARALGELKTLPARRKKRVK